MAKDRRLLKAERFLRTAHLALRDGDYDSAASRAYYAVYHAFVCLLDLGADIRQERWDHIDLLARFSQEFCKRRGLFSTNDYRDVTRLQEMRLFGDYQYGFVGQKQAEWAVSRATSLIEKAKGIMRT